jgi:hypothetical protein
VGTWASTGAGSSSAHAGSLHAATSHSATSHAATSHAATSHAGSVRARAMASRVNVVLHVRRDDSRGKLPLDFYSSTIAYFRAEMAAGRLLDWLVGASGAGGLPHKEQQGRRPQMNRHTAFASLLFRIQTDGSQSEMEGLFTSLRSGTSGGLGSRAVRSPADMVVVDYSRNESLALAFHRMVTADVLVMSRSSLSMAAALLSNGTILFPSCWHDRRPLPHWRLWPCTSK